MSGEIDGMADPPLVIAPLAPKPPSREPAVGRVAVCSIGYLGIIEGRATMPWGEAWVGRGLVTGQRWSSRNPVVLSEQDEAAVLRALGGVA